MIIRTTTIEEIAEINPVLIQYLSEKGIRCIRCGEPIWSTIEEAAKEKDFSDNEIENFIAEMNLLLN